MLPVGSFAETNDAQERRVDERDISDIVDRMTLEEESASCSSSTCTGKRRQIRTTKIPILSNNRGAKNFKEAIEKYHIGGVIYFNWTDNINAP